MRNIGKEGQGKREVIELIFFFFFLACKPYLSLCVRYNIRELFEIYSSQKDPEKIKALISDGWKSLETMQQLTSLDEESLDKIFRSDQRD